jgi:hypothetical protein
MEVGLDGVGLVWLAAPTNCLSYLHMPTLYRILYKKSIWKHKRQDDWQEEEEEKEKEKEDDGVGYDNRVSFRFSVAVVI